MMCHSTPENTFPFYTFDSYLYGDGTFTDDIMNKVSITHFYSDCLSDGQFILRVYKKHFKTHLELFRRMEMLLKNINLLP